MEQYKLLIWLAKWLPTITSVIVLLLLAAGFLAREKIKQVLGRAVLLDVEREKKRLEGELAEKAAGYERDLETYRVSLVTEAERAKAVQHVRMSISLLLAERRFKAIAAMADAIQGVGSTVPAILAQGQTDNTQLAELYFDKKKELHEKMNAASAAYDVAVVYFDRDLALAVNRFNIAFNTALQSRYRVSDPALALDDARLIELRIASIDAEQRLNAVLIAMEDLGPAPAIV